MKVLKYTFIVLCLTLLGDPNISFAQSKDTPQTTEGGTVNVTGRKKINTESTIIKFWRETFTKVPKRHIVNNEIPTLGNDERPLGPTEKQIPVKDSSKITKSLNKIEFLLGSYYNTSLKSNISNASQTFTFELEHNSNQIGSTNDWNSKSFYNNVSINPKLTFFNKFEWDSEISFGNRGSYYFGYENSPPKTISSGNEIKFENWKYHGKLSNDESGNKLKWDAIFDGEKLFGLEGLNETNLTGNLNFKRDFDFESVKGLGINIKNSFINSTYSITSIVNERSLFQSNPTLYFNVGKFALMGGVIFINEYQKIFKKYLFPSFDFRYSFSDNHHFNVGYKGEIKFNNFNDFTFENIFLSNQQAYFENTERPSKYYAILNGENSNSNDVDSKYDYTIELAYSSVRNLPVFINNKRNSERDPLNFNIEYVGKNNNVLNLLINATFNYKYKNTWGNSLNIKSDNYSGEIGYSNIIMKPSVEVTNKIDYSGRNWDLGISFAYTGGLYGFQTKENQIVRMNDIVLINLSGNYQLSNSFRFNWIFNNLLNQKYQRIINYREIGFNFNAGVLYEF